MYFRILDSKRLILRSLNRVLLRVLPVKLSIGPCIKLINTKEKQHAFEHNFNNTHDVVLLFSLMHECIMHSCNMHYLFAVARWLLCLLSDYKSATCSER